MLKIYQKLDNQKCIPESQNLIYLDVYFLILKWQIDILFLVAKLLYNY